MTSSIDDEFTAMLAARKAERERRREPQMRSGKQRVAEDLEREETERR
jgi:hypothetical protein